MTPRRSVAPSLGVCQRAPAFVLLEGLGLRLSVSAAEAKRRIRGSREGSASLGASASSRRLGGPCPAPVLRRSSAAVVGGGVQRT